VDDANPPGSLADDPAFLDGLQDLDRGLGPDRGNERAVPARRAEPTPPTPAGKADETADFVPDTLFEVQTPAALRPAAPRPRPLLELFPPTKPDKKRKPAPPASTLPQAAPPATVQREPAPAPASASPEYVSFYGLNESPFAPESDARFFYPSASHAHVLNGALEAIRAAEGLIVLTGDDGLGKTTICRTAARDLDRRTLLALVLDPPQTIDQLLQTVLVDFGVVSRGDLAGGMQLQRDALVTTLASFLKSLVPLKANAVIAIDDAHTMPVEAMAGIADLVAALESPRHLQIVLVGAPALASIVKRAGLRAPVGRNGIQLELRPLDDEEVAAYVRHRLRIAGGGTRVDLSPGAIRCVALASRGVPRLVNQLCERALTAGATGEASVIDSALVEDAAKDLGLQIPADQPRTAPRRAVIAMVLLALLLAAAVVAWLFR
jgi:general secretion pathway protein A